MKLVSNHSQVQCTRRRDLYGPNDKACQKRASTSEMSMRAFATSQAFTTMVDYCAWMVLGSCAARSAIERDGLKPVQSSKRFHMLSMSADVDDLNTCQTESHLIEQGRDISLTNAEAKP